MSLWMKRDWPMFKCGSPATSKRYLPTPRTNTSAKASRSSQFTVLILWRPNANTWWPKQNQQQVAQSTVPGVASSAASLLDAAAERLKQWGVPQKEIARLESTGQVQQELEVDSPVSGYITERNALPSVAVQPEMRLYTIADLSTVWVQAQVFQNDLERIKIGAPATLTVNTYPGRTFTGRVDFIYPQVDMDTRTAKVRVVFSNPGLQLKPGMFVNVSLKVPMGNQLVIPATGVLQSGTRRDRFCGRVATDTSSRARCSWALAWVTILSC